MRKSLRTLILVSAVFAVIAAWSTPASSLNEQASPKPNSHPAQDYKNLSVSPDDVARAAQAEPPTVPAAAKPAAVAAFAPSGPAAERAGVSETPAQSAQKQGMCFLLLLLSMPHK